MTVFFTLAQLQKAADPWVLKHSDLEKQDNSWKEVSGVAGGPCAVLLATLESLSLLGNVTRTMLILSHRSHTLTPLGSSILRSLLHGSSLETCKEPPVSSILPCLGQRLGVSLCFSCGFLKSRASKELCDPGQVTLPLWAPVASLVK